MHFRRLSACAGLTAALALLATTATARAASGPRIAASATGLLTSVASSYLAGYTTTQVGISRAAATFVVPTVTCPTSDTQGTAVGVGDEQTQGSPTLLAIVFLACAGGAPLLETQVTAGDTNQFGSAATGDRISVLILQTPTKVTATLRNRTQGTTVTASGIPVPDNTMTFGSFPLFSGTILPVADFGSVVIGKPVLENTTLGAWSPTKLVRKSGATTQISTSGFFAAGGFRLTFLAN